MEMEFERGGGEMEREPKRVKDIWVISRHSSFQLHLVAHQRDTEAEAEKKTDLKRRDLFTVVSVRRRWRRKTMS